MGTKEKIGEYVSVWEQRCYSSGIPNDTPSEIEDLVPSYKRICKAIMKNDMQLKGLGFTPQESEYYNILKRIELGITSKKNLQYKLFA